MKKKVLFFDKLWQGSCITRKNGINFVEILHKEALDPNTIYTIYISNNSMMTTSFIDELLYGISQSKSKIQIDSGDIQIQDLINTIQKLHRDTAKKKSA